MAPLLQIEGLKTYFHTEGGVVKAVDGLSVSVDAGRTLGIVGESGSGKSVTSLSIMRLLPAASSEIAAGKITLLGKDIIHLPEAEMRKVRGADASMIFQEPGTSLNPVYRVGYQVAEAIRQHQKVSAAEARRRTIELFKEVGIPNPEQRIDSFPHEMSGGQKQRVMIAMALSCSPKLLIADEPTTALDVTIQKQILDLLRNLRDNRHMGIVFITHDLGVIAEIADDVAVMYRGQLVEYGPVDQIFAAPKHPYTKGLMACRPQLDTKYRILPTVADFMDSTRREDGSYEIREKSLDPKRLLDMTTMGRGRLLSPVAEIGRGTEQELRAHLPSDTQFVPAGTPPLLSVKNLKVYFPIRKGVFRSTVGHVKAVDDVSFNVYPGQTLGLVGESGCGKTTTGRAITRLAAITGGEILFRGADITSLGGAKLKEYRRHLQIIFQDPYSSLNPRMTVEAMLTEAMSVHGLGNSRSDRRDRAASLLTEVGLDPSHLGRYPHEFSGGQRQRISIARAVAVEPQFIICDESVSALDVSVQAQVLNLLKRLQQSRGLTYIFISHDLSVVKFMSDMMVVMQSGKIVEAGPSDLIYAAPTEEYTRELIKSIPEASLAKIRERSQKRSTAPKL